MMELHFNGSQSVEVTGSLPLLPTERSDVGTQFETRQVAGLPLT